LQPAAPAALFFSLFTSDWGRFWDALREELVAAYGPIGRCVGPLPFGNTEYYYREFGQPLTRRLLVFEELIAQERLVEAKLFADRLEREYAARLGSAADQGGAARIFNLDPGLLSLERLVLATGKNYTHRIYLGQGVWADLTLYYQHGAWRSSPWTFPDYASPELQAHLTELREYYRERRRAKNGGQKT
jgi:hypothetical protein